MASLITRKTERIIDDDTGARRKRGKRNPLREIRVRLSDDEPPVAIPLGRVPLSAAESATTYIGRLEAAYRFRAPIDAETLRWAEGVSDALRERLARLGLIPSDLGPGRPEPTPRLRSFLARYLFQRRRQLKPSTRHAARLTVRRLVDFMGDDEARLDEVTPDKAGDFVASLRKRGLSEATIRGFIRHAKIMFGAGEHGAVGRGLLDRSPFLRFKSSAIAAERDRYISRAEYQQLIDAAPSVQWRTLIGLARLAGLRTPSETHGLTWAGVDFDRRRLTVHAPKTNRIRQVPIDPDLLSLLQDAFDAAEPGTERVITLPRNNLRRGFLSIIAAAGLTQWPDVFQALRRGAATDWARNHPGFAAAAWAGHGALVAARHYHQLTDDLFDAASGRTKRHTSTDAHGDATEAHEPEESEEESAADQAESPENAGECVSVQDDAAMGRAGLEPATLAFSVGNHARAPRTQRRSGKGVSDSGGSDDGEGAPNGTPVDRDHDRDLAQQLAHLPEGRYERVLADAARFRRILQAAMLGGKGGAR